MKTPIFILILSVALRSFAQEIPGDARGTTTDSSKVDVAAVCEHFEYFKNLNKVLCAAAEQVRSTSTPIMIDKSIACIYPVVREDARVCPKEELEALNLPDIPFLDDDLPMWPTGKAPLLTKVNGKALNAALPLHASFFSDEFALESSCNSQDGDLKKTDRILCAPFVADLALDVAGTYNGDPRDLVIERLKNQIQKLEAELSHPEPAAEAVVVPEEPQAVPEVSGTSPATEDIAPAEEVKDKPKTLKVYGNE